MVFQQSTIAIQGIIEWQREEEKEDTNLATAATAYCSLERENNASRERSIPCGIERKK
jgi:hypothetical protein